MSSQEITDRQQAEDALRLTQYTIDHCSTAIYWLHSTGKVFYTNEAARRQLGYSREEMLRLSVCDFDADWPADYWLTGWQNVKQAGVLKFESYHRRKDGHIFPVEVTTNYIEHAGEEYVFAFATDISERERAEEALRLTQYAIDHCSTAIAWIRPNGRIFYTNEAQHRQLGYSREEFQTMSVSDVDPDWPTDFWPTGWQKFKQAGVVTFETRHRRKDGHIFPVEVTTNYMEWGGEEYLFAFVTDITERKRAEQELRDSETRLHAIFDHHFQLTGLLDCEGRLLAANKTALDFAGAGESEVIGQYFWETAWWPPSQEPKLRHAIQRAAQGEFVRFDCSHLRADGEVRDFDFSLSPVRDGEGNVVYIVPEGRDITDMKRAEERLREHEARLAHVARLSTMGEMAAGIAHEVGQPLHAIVNLAQATGNVLGAEGEPNVSDLREWNAAIARSAERAADVVRWMRSFARRDESERSICLLNEVVRESVQLVAFEARRCGAAVQLVLTDTAPRVDVRPVQIQQVLVNLLRNAFEAMGEAESETREVTIRVEPDGKSVRVSVADTGPGLPASEDQDIFEPFVTHRERGLGLGLAISSSIVKAHGGKLWAESTAGGGAAFHFALPAVREQVQDVS